MKKVLFFVLSLCLLAPVLSSCKPDPVEPEVKLKAPILSAKLAGESVTLTWNMVTNATSYQVEYKTSTDSEFLVAGKPTNSPYTITDLEFGKTYDFRVKALSASIEGEYSKVVSIALERFLDKPEAAAMAGITFIDVTWAPVAKAASYKVEHKSFTDASYTTDYEGTGDDLFSDEKYSFHITGLSGGITYDVRVAAVAAGYSDTWSEIVTVTTTAEPSNMIHNADEFASWLAGLDSENTDVAALANDIDLSGKTITSAPGFSGTLEGQGFALKNLKSSVPLFEKLSGNLSNIVIDSSCEFTTTEQIFGAIAKEDSRAVYTNVVNKAAVTFTASGNVTGGISLGGFSGGSNTSTFINCTNEGAVTVNAAGYTHEAAFVAGFVGVSYEHTQFTGCKNAAPVSLNAAGGNPRSNITIMGETRTNGNAGIGVAGFVGRSFTQSAIEDEATAKENSTCFEQCENLQGGVITLNYSNISAISGDGKNGNVDVAGIAASGNNYIYKCFNYADVNLNGLSSSAVDKKEFIIHVGGIFGKAWNYTCVGSCKMLGNINVVDDCIADNANVKAGVGGILGCGGYNGPGNSGQTEINYCSFSGNINISGKGKCIAIGGISGWNGKQWNNSVKKGSKINCTLTGAWSLVGGLVGGLGGGATWYTVKSCSCEADISVTGSAGNVGGLLGRWCGAQGYGDIAPFIGRKGDVSCSFHGNVYSDQSVNIGFIVGYIDGSGKTVEFGSTDFPIKVSGTFQNGSLTSPVEITSENIETYKWGANKANTTMVVNVTQAE